MSFEKCTLFYEHLSIKKLIVQNGLLVLTSRNINILDLLQRNFSDGFQIVSWKYFRYHWESLLNFFNAWYWLSKKNGWFGNSVNL